MAIKIVPRQDLAPLKGEIVEAQRAFHAPATIERTPEQEAVVQETHGNTVRELALGYQQDLANKINSQLGVSAHGHMVRMAVEINQCNKATPELGEGMEAILSAAASALMQQITATIQMTTVLQAQTIGEMANKVPTGKKICERWEKEEEQRRRDEEQRRRQQQERKPGLIELLLGK